MKKLANHDLSWCVRRLPATVQKLLEANQSTLFLGGGYVRSMIAREPVNDVDLFTSTKEIAQKLSQDFAGSTAIVTTDNAYTVLEKLPVQFIHRWTYEKPEDLLNSFDFTIASAAFWHSGNGWDSMCHDDFYSDLAGRRLVYMKPKRNEDVGGSILRVLKFYQAGYRIPLDSLGAVIARLVNGIDRAKIEGGAEATSEEQWAKVVTGLLREVDPNVNPDHIPYFPSETPA
jgi:hypothetical protein